MGRLGRELGKALFETVFIDTPRPLMLGLGSLSLAIGIFLFRDFPVFSDSVSYRFMRHISEDGWGVIFSLIGGSCFTVALLLETLMPCPKLRHLPFALNLTNAFCWLLVWAGIVASNPNTMGTIIYFFLILAPAWCALRTWRPARVFT